ncbi:leukocidin family pore-forming toxin [Vibrio azureus]|uniref:Ricin B lectin domain-containing protein n=1 Tax=Vibrio azureus NBRC 104587 TaxID=1219077 RepID=U3C7Z5_9VIBR|nr:leukocidin family pore-forming toxin [Vibrio azureus]GAD74578.1 hypothetical protein VAZ01S_012_00590 [Vibrio azureus NBRC 104587]
MSKKLFSIAFISYVIFSSQAIAEPYIPIFKKGVYVTKHGLECVFDKSFKADYGKVDLCNANASVDVRFEIAQMRSVFNNANGESTENKKYVSFIVGDNSGAGIHVSDRVVQEHTRFTSWTERDDFIGGFAREYGISVEPIAGYTPSIYKQFPLNENKNYQHRDTTGFTIGINGSIKADIGEFGPKFSPEVSGSYTYTNKKTIVYNTSDYKIVNLTNHAKFEVKYVYDVNLCNSTLGGRGLYDCSWKDVLWGSSFVHDLKKINPVAYANFHPKMELIYEAPADEIGTTHFEITVFVAPQIIYGNVSYDGFSQKASAELVNTHHYLIKANVVIDWGHPLFEPEAHVYLQTLESNDKCLTVKNEEVLLSQCNGNWDQTWGLDNYQRYKSRSGHDLCLSVQDDKSLAIEQCSFAMNQKWYWEGEQLLSRFIDGSGEQYGLNASSGRLNVVPVNGEKALTRFMPALAKID